MTMINDCKCLRCSYLRAKADGKLPGEKTNTEDENMSEKTVGEARYNVPALHIEQVGNGFIVTEAPHQRGRMERGEVVESAKPMVFQTMGGLQAYLAEHFTVRSCGVEPQQHWRETSRGAD